MATQALQAVVLCGGLGNRMTDLTNHIPKCMLPIVGIPMFWYPLNFLQRNSIKEVIVVVAEKLLSEIKQLLSGSSLPPLNDLQIEFVKLNSVAEHWGTADVLRFIDARIKKDFIVVSGDFVSDMNLAPMLSLHAAENATLTCLLCDRVITGPVPGPKIKQSKGIDFRFKNILKIDGKKLGIYIFLNGLGMKWSTVGRDLIVLSENNQLLFDGLEEDYEETIALNIDLFNKCRTAYFTAKYSDCHLYIMKKWILNIIKQHRNFSSLKADLIPYILEKQNAKDCYELNEHIRIDSLDEKVQKFSFGTTTVKDLQYSSLKCFAYLLPPENGLIVGHVNTIGAYFEINKAIIRFLSSFSEKIPIGQPVSSIGATVVSECYVGSTTHLFQQSAGEAHFARSEKPLIKRSVVGEKCTIGPKSKIINSLVMDGCQIGAGAQIINSVICMNVEIGENANIFSSIVVSQRIISADAKVQDELVAPDDEIEFEKWAQEP